LETVEDLLREVPAFQGLEPAALETIAGCGSNVHFGADDVIFREGDPADTFYVIRHGRAAIETFVPTSGPVTIETLDPGELLGWSWLFPPFRTQFDARALTDVRATAFDGACLRGKCDADPALGYALLLRFAHVFIERLQWTRLRLLDVYGYASRD
jgi:CRP-like cAMP-binding protein